MHRLSLVLLGILLLALPLRADEVTLKNGKVMKDLSLVKETATTLVFKTLDGRRVSIQKADVLRHVKKPTVRDELKQRKKALGPKDGRGWADLGLWAKEQGLSREWRPILKKAIKIDPALEDARLALGYEKVDGKWLTASEAKRRRAKAKEAEYKAKGYKKYKGEYVSPAEYTRLKKGLVKHGDHWVTKDIKKKIDTKGWVLAEGEWMAPEDKEKVDAGYRKWKGKWKTIDELDDIHSTMEDPWILRTSEVELRTSVTFKRGRQLKNAAEDAFQFLRALLQMQPDIEGDGGRVLVVCGRELEDYKKLGNALANDDRSADQSGKMGVFYVKELEKKRPGACTYFFNEDFARYWVSYGAAQTYINRLRAEGELNQPLFRALCAYAAASHNGKFKPTWFYYSRFINDPQNPYEPLTKTLQEISPPNESRTDRTARSAGRASLALHFLRSTAPAEFESFFREAFILGEKGPMDLLKACAKGQDDEAMNKAFASFLDKYKKEFRPWDK